MAANYLPVNFNGFLLGTIAQKSVKSSSLIALRLPTETQKANIPVRRNGQLWKENTPCIQFELKRFELV